MANQTRQLARLLRESGIQVDVIQVNAPYVPAWIGRVPIARAAFRLIPYLFRLWAAAGRVDLFHVMANSGWAWHLFAVPAIWIASWRGTPVIVNYRGGEAPVFFRRQFRWVRPTLMRATLIVVPSDFLREVFLERGFEATIVPNIIDLSRFPAAAPPAYPPHVIVTRNLEDLYDIPTAIRAFSRIRSVFPQAKMTIAGSGPCRGKLEALCRAISVADAVTFTGRIDNEGIAELYRQAHVMLNPSLADNFPISILEAMASGVPVVTTNVGGIPYLVRDGITGILVSPRNPEAMAAAAIRILTDTALRDRLRKAALEEVQQYTWERVRRHWFDVYGRITGRDARSLCVPERT